MTTILRPFNLFHGGPQRMFSDNNTMPIQPISWRAAEILLRQQRRADSFPCWPQKSFCDNKAEPILFHVCRGDRFAVATLYQFKHIFHCVPQRVTHPSGSPTRRGGRTPWRKPFLHRQSQGPSCAFWISFPFAFTKPNRRAGRALNAHRRGVKLLLFDSKTFSGEKKKKF